MNVMDFELLRERRAELLREAGSKRAFRRQRSDNHQKSARGVWKLASAWVIGR